MDYFCQTPLGLAHAAGHGEASAPNAPPDLMVTGSANSHVNLPGCSVLAASSTSPGPFGRLSNSFMITGGTGDVMVQFAAHIDGMLHVMTDACGVLAETEVIFNLTVDGNPTLFHNDLLAIGPSDAMTRVVSQTLSDTVTLQFDTPYFLLLEVNSESRAVNDVPEPATFVLLLSGCLGLLLTAWRRHRRARGHVPCAVQARHGLLLSLPLILLFCAVPVQARYIGGEAPLKTGCACNQPGGAASYDTQNTSSSCGCAISFSDSNLREQVPISVLKSTNGPIVNLVLTYNSYNADGSHAQVDTVLGYGWTHSYNIFLFTQLGHIFRMDGDGRVTKRLSGNMTWQKSRFIR